ncbi:MFS transporter [Ihubacter massiliensis]|uniref:MFS transporter n=1 Tax=Hominibacterium faecale TaxID=2839743 RepID=A0A9J6QJF0_9FIRM|nr:MULTISPECIES: MFS transporter [Eubacteriales Family XIII. Incertae Sedis]MCI7304238.1 MFS transporter [Clostridia bacterium]MDE8734133.1 MFS transporter [Eubacteriales bacterium DFI.9.88]MDY3010465.1 MFS transporter [Clostridiales Family XIII bacterium]MCO7121839.1 MFS transporter [Ihubacter massiliensis]MCU7377616.1 MFS transporter [Hominibacterium faecale]
MEGSRSRLLKFKTYFSYAVGQIQDGIPYNFINYYLLLFMTDMAGLNPAVAGTILFIAVIWDGITDPAVGYISDNLRGGRGKRRPFILGAAIPVLLCMLLLFAPFELPEWLKFPYYLVATLLFWTSYTCYSIPFNSFGAEIVTDTNERNNMKTICGFFLYFGVWLATAGPQFIQSITAGMGISEKTTWFYAALFMGLIGTLAAFLCWFMTKGVEKTQIKEELPENRRGLGEAIKNVYASYKLLLKTKSVRIICLMALVYNTFFAVKATGFVYLMANNLTLDSAMQALFWTIAAVLNYAVLPVLNLIANKLSKKTTFILMWALMIAFALIFAVVQISSFAVLVGYQVIFAFANVCFWVIGYSLAYDCVEVVEFQHGENKSGGIVGLFTLCQKVGYAIGGWMAGAGLTIIGYDAAVEVQSGKVLIGINTLMTAVPAVILLIGLILMIRFPINRIKHRKLLAALERKKKGEEYSTEGFEDIF